MDQPRRIWLTRDELYEKVWSVPTQTLAVELGLSDVGLAKVCKRHNVPRPSRGHWAKVAAGQASPRTPLPTADETASEKISLVIGGSSMTPPTIEQPTDADIVELLGKLRALSIVVKPDTLGRHPVAEKTLEALERSAKTARSQDPSDLISTSWDLQPRCLHVIVSRASMPRAIAIIDALLKAFDAIGAKGLPCEEQRSRGWTLQMLGEKIYLQLREKTKRRPHQPSDTDGMFPPKHDFVADGTFELRASLNGQTHSPSVWSDTKQSTIEARLPAVIEGVVFKIDRERKERAVRAKREAERHQEQMRAHEARMARDELIATAKALLDETADWHAAQSLRTYADTVRLVIERRSPIQEGSDAHKWLLQAEQIAGLLDPLTHSHGKRLRLREIYPATQPYGGGYGDMGTHAGGPPWAGAWWHRNRR